LKRKYGPTLEAILLYLGEINEKLEGLTSGVERLSELESRLKPLEQKVMGLAERLSEKGEGPPPN